MKKIATLILSCIALTGLAQPTITSSMAPQIGQTEISYYADTIGVSPGNSGANQTWNFSTVTPNGNIDQLTYINPAGTPWVSSFPNSNLAALDTTSGSYNISYLQNTSNSTQLLGFSYSSSNIDIYSNPYSMGVYPFTYTSSYTDLYAINNSNGKEYRYGSVTALGDAYGTVITPAGTFSNTLRIKYIGTETDSVISMSNPPEVTHSSETRYAWLNGSGLYGRFSIGYYTYVDVTGTYYYKIVKYGPGITGIKENSLLSLNAYPNPTVDNTEVAFTPHKSGNAIIEVMDYNGKRIAYWTIETQANQTQNLRIKLLTEPSGLYQVRIAQGNEIYSSRILKQ